MTRAVILLSVLLLGAPASEARGPGEPSSTDPLAVETELREHCERITTSDDQYFGRVRLRRLSVLIRNEPASSQRSLHLRGALAAELHQQGELPAAIELLESMRRDVEDGSIETEPEIRATILSLLGIAHLQLAEERNCVASHVPASCILPITAEAVHREADHTRLAGDLFLERLERFGDEAQARWLLNLARMLSGDHPEGVPGKYRIPEGILTPPDGDHVWRDVSAELGIKVFDLAGGAAMEDFNGDGLLDLVSSTWDPCDGVKAFRNRGDGGFEDVSEAWGLDEQLGALNLVTGDYDGDGMVDILLLRGGWQGEDGRMRNSLLSNDLKRASRRFTDATAAAGLDDPAYPTQTAAWADYDGDGDLDLYVGNESAASTTDPVGFDPASGGNYPSQLFRNEGDGRFVDVARELGVTNDRFAKGVAWGDVDEDGDPDLFVSNIGPNRLYRNDGDDGFVDIAAAAGVEEPRRSFATWFFDFDADGRLDLFVADYGSPVESVSASHFGAAEGGDGAPVLYRNVGGTRFERLSRTAAPLRPALPMGANHGDFDADGRPDVYLGTGVPRIDALMPNVALVNEGGSFRDATFELGLGHLQKGHGVAFGDLDQDGDQDLFQQLGGAFPYDDYGNVLYLNPTPDPRWIVLFLEGRRANRFGVGARIALRVVEGETTRPIHVLAGTGGSFGASSLRQEIGLGRATEILELRITWPGSGTVQTFEGVAPNRAYRVVEEADRLVPVAYRPIPLGGGDHPSSHSPKEPDPVAARSRLAEGERLLAEGALAAAEERLAQATSLDPRLAEAWSALGRARARQRRYVDAREPLERAMELGRRDFPTLLYLASVSWEVGDLARSEELFRALLEVAPGHPLVQQLLGRLLLWQGRAEEAVAHLEAATAADPGALDVAADLARALEGAGRLDTALAAHRRILELDPNHAEARYGLARVLLRQGEREAAEEQLAIYRELYEAEQAATRDRGLVQATLDEVQVLVEGGQLDAALEVLARAARDFPENAEIARRLTEIRMLRATSGTP